MTKVQLSLPDQEVSILQYYGNQLGYSLPKIIRFVITKASEEILEKQTIPTYQMSEKTEQKGIDALQAYRKGQTKEVKNIEEFFRSL